MGMITHWPGIDGEVFVGFNIKDTFLKLIKLEPIYESQDGVSSLIYKVAPNTYYEMSLVDNIVFISGPKDPKEDARLRAILKALEGGDE